MKQRCHIRDVWHRTAYHSVQAAQHCAMVTGLRGVTVLTNEKTRCVARWGAPVGTI